MAVVRLLPIAPFTIVNVVAGASHLRLRDYLLGTLLGMSPGIVLTVVFSHNLAEAIRHPSLETVLVLVAVTVALMLVAFGLQKLFRPRGQERGRASSQRKGKGAAGPRQGEAAVKVRQA